MPQICNYFVTLRCNDTCEFCSIWQNKEYQKITEQPCDLTPLKIAGIQHLKVTGGEPLLREDLPQILEQAKQLGFFVELTTNGIAYSSKAKLITGCIDRLCFSLDYPFAQEHDRSRGIECFHEVLQGITLAKKYQKEVLVHFTLTRDNVRFLPEMVDLTERLQVLLYIEPVYDFYGTQGFEPATLAYIYYYARRKNVLINYAVFEFLKSGGNRVLYPRCRAKETSLTLLPDGRRVSPCFFNPGGKQGREDICSSCMRWPYMLPSFSRGIDKYFWLNAYSELRNRIKRGKQLLITND